MDDTPEVERRLRALRDQLAAELVKAHRAAGEPSYSTIARQLRVSKATVHRLLNGVGGRSPKWHHVDDMLEVFGRSDRDVDRLRTLWIEIRELENAVRPRRNELEDAV